MNRLCALSLALLFASLPTSEQVIDERSIEVYSGAGSARKMDLIPPSAMVLFPTSTAFLDKQDVVFKLPVADGAPLQKLQFVTVRKYSTRNPGASSARITAVVYSGTIYLVNELLCDDNVSVINRILRSVGASVDSPEEAMQVARFFLQVGYYHFVDPDKFITSTVGDLPAKQVEFPGQDATAIQSAIHPPAATRDGNTFKVEIVTKDRDSPFVLLRHWSIKIRESQIIEANEEVLYPTRMHYRAGEGAGGNSLRGTLASPLSTLRFQLSMMSDGKTSDSEALNVSTYTFNTSDGPQVARSVYYLDSTERSTRELDSELRRASQIIERANWTDGRGNVLGERALVLYSVQGTDTIRASLLLRRDTKVFEISSSCLRNLLEFEKVWFHSNSKSTKD
jgi:hypothetical protein